LTAGGARRGRLLCAAAFVVGICTCYATAGYLAACAGKAVVASPLAYDLTALALCAAGLYGLLADRCAAKASPSAGFALAGLCSSAASPCCTALIVPIAIAAADAGQPARAALLMACFSLGHVFPSAAAAVWTHMRRNSSGMRAYLPALRTVAAAVTLATGVYYAVLA
jgi:cytochrome c biogenesis protein CcdA